MKHPTAASAAGAKDWFRIQAAAKTDDAPASADVYIYEHIGQDWWGDGVGAKTFSEQLDALDVDTIRLYLNSPGGAAWEGVAIMNSLRRHKARIEVIVDGIAASAASVIAMAGDHITMNRGSELMIHDAWGMAAGNAKDMEDTALILAKLSDSLADTYAARAGKDRAYWRDLMRAETWYTAEEAVIAGLADEWVDAPAASAAFDLSKLGFAFAGRAHAPAPRIETPELPSSTEPGNTNRKENVVAYDDLKAGLRERLGMADAAASDEQLLAAVDETLTAKADITTPEGTVLIDSTMLADLQASAALGRQAREEQDTTRRESIVHNAVSEGRISPASRETWLAQLATNEEGTNALIGSLAKNTVPVAEIGTAEEPSEADSLYASAWGTDTKEA
ncbi:head maturation protease, ClpP-related [Cryobacterium psychrophilum]|uniref:ATP-dependent Clp protease proteolytic subunit n=1 Tax=Cryobacterium psychrophilum TaxID=41988 RepID=A0A4Y8KQ08_9MICO|nr:head maturation protease, ClpP-related [Cryobacterium psychrophilum]TDW31015.1 ATP-dependent protease ClpP protease subunit [Cryobacterium psychrophilum]TFD80870.1 peptidase [Cryobacterium psychrophilum]